MKRLNFFWELFAETGVISSKRFIAISGMVCLLFMVVYGQLTGKVADEYQFTMVLTAVLGASGITAYEKVKAKAKNPTSNE